MNNKKQQSFFQLGLIFGIAIFLNILGGAFFTHFDLTEDKRFTLAKPTKKLLNELDDVVYIEVLLEGEFPAGFKRLQRSVKEMIEDFRSESGGLVDYAFVDPNKGTIDNVNLRREELAKDGILPTNLRIKEKEGTAERLIYPYAKLTYRNRLAVVDLLDEEAGGANPDEQLNYSISQLEYNFANALHKLKIGAKEVIAFTVGHGELNERERAEFVKSLRSYYEVGTFNLDSAIVIPQKIAVLIVAKPKANFSDRDQFLIDQYVMNGGKILWLIDQLNVELDSMRRTNDFVARDYNLGLDGLFFKYGVRVNPDLVLDLQCSRIPMVIDHTGKQELFKWYYHPIAVPNINHPIVKSLDGINLQFPSSIDTVKTKTDIKKTVLLSSSEYGRMQPNITRLNFEILRYEPDPEKFTKSDIPMAVLLEGEFSSFFENKTTQGMRDMLTNIGQEFKEQSEPTRMIVVADGDVGRPYFNPINGQFFKLGYNPYERYGFANKDFLINAVEYLKDEEGIIEARSKEIKLRLLDSTQAEEDSTYWQLFNIGLPLLLLMIFGLIYNALRKRRYTK